MGVRAKEVSIGAGFTGHEDAEDGSFGYDSPSDVSENGDTAVSEDVSDYEGKDPKTAPPMILIAQERCRKVFHLTGDAANGIERVCGGIGGKCTRAGHTDPTCPMGPSGFYQSIKTAKRVDGILSTHMFKSAYKVAQDELKKVRQSELSILKDSPGYKRMVKAAAQELDGEENDDLSEEDDTLYESADGGRGWEDLGTTIPPKPAAKTPKAPKTNAQGSAKIRIKKSSPTGTELRNNRTKIKLKMSPTKTAEDPNQALLKTLVNSVQAMAESVSKVNSKVNSMESQWTRVQGKKKRVQDKSSDEDVSADEDTDDSFTAPHASHRRNGRAKVGSSDEDDTSDDSRRQKKTTTDEKAKQRGRRIDPKCRTARYYAVAVGVKPGVYTSWAKAKPQVNGYPGAIHKSFRKKADARRYVRENQRAYDDDEDDDFDAPSESDGSGFTSSDGEPPSRRRNRCKVPPISGDLIAPDPSLGKSKEFFGFTIQDEIRMRAEMSPAGVDKATQKALAGATLDAVQLPGRSSEVEVESSTASMVAAISELAEDRRGEWFREDGPRRDVQWQSASRTSLKAITSYEILHERYTELQSLRGSVQSNQVLKFRTILSGLHWSSVAIQQHALANWFQRVGDDTHGLYAALHLHLINLHLKHGWEYTALSIKHHAKHLANIRAQAPGRLTCMVRLYIYLRDANEQSFYSEKLQEKRNLEVMEKLSSLEIHGSGTGQRPCAKCGMMCKGKSSCPFRSFSDAEAKKRIKSVWEFFGKLSPQDLSKLIPEEE